MRYRTLGRSGLRVADVFLGTMTFGADWGWGAPIEECRRLLDAYAEAGGNVIDTANNYTEGNSERIVGELLGGDRDQYVLSTKYTLSLDGTDANASGNHRKSLTRSLEQSLTRLRTDRIDLFWVHIWDPRTPIEETMRALDDAVRAGKILYVGISDAPAWVVARANAIAELRGWSPFVGLQIPYSLVQREVERDLLPMADALGLSIAAWSPLAGGILSGKFSRDTAKSESRDTAKSESRDTAKSESGTRVDAAKISERDLGIARVVDTVADELGVSSSQVALAWTHARRPSVHPVIGARRLDQLTDNLAAVDLALPDDALRRLDEASAIELGFPHDFIAGTREFVYGPVGLQTV